MDQLNAAWNWLLEKSWAPLLFSAFGDVFMERSDGVFWLNTGTGVLEKISVDRQVFQSQLSTEVVSEWFLPTLIERLKDEGKLLLPGQCYSFKTFPVFAEGKYETGNIHILSAKEHFAWSGDLHRQIRDIPDGGKVKVTVTS